MNVEEQRWRAGTNEYRWNELWSGFRGRLLLSGLMISAGMGIELVTLFWIHTVSLTVFLLPGAGLVLGGMALFLWTVVANRKQSPLK